MSRLRRVAVALVATLAPLTWTDSVNAASGILLLQANPADLAGQVGEAAQPPASPGLPPSGGFYLDPLKLVPLILLFLLWVWSTNWAGRDANELGLVSAKKWNAFMVAGGVVGFLLALAIPIYFVGLITLLLLQFGPLLAYVGVRNQLVEEEEKVLTPYHIGEILNGLLAQANIRPVFNRGGGETVLGPPVDIICKTRFEENPDPERLGKADESDFLFPAKELLHDAILSRATEILLEPTAEQLAVTYKVDGLPVAAEPFDKETGLGVLEVLKILGGMDPAERRKTQTGGFIAKSEGQELDVRIRAAGQKGGDKMRLKFINLKPTVATLEDLGLAEKTLDSLRELLAMNNAGMLVVATLPEQGKTTTLFTLIREIDRYTRNIYTIEKEIELKLDNIIQHEIDPAKELTASVLLTKILKQDCDVLMISDLEDKETATLACQAAANGRLVIVGVNAPDAVSGLMKLYELQVDPMLLGSVLIGSVSQRLVRLLEEDIKEPWTPKPEFLQKLGLSPNQVEALYRVPTDPAMIPPGSNGYLGRAAIFELLVVNDPIKELLRDTPSASAIKAEARKAGMTTLREDGVRLVAQGKTSVDELQRVLNLK